MALGRQRGGIDVLIVVSVILLSLAICNGLCSHDVNPSLTNWTASGDDAAFVCCSGTWDSHDIDWQKRVDVKGTRWCGQWGKLKAFIKENAVYGVQTLAMMYRHCGTPEYCINGVPRHYSYWYAARWLVFGHFDASPPVVTSFTSHNGSLSGCVASTHFTTSKIAFPFIRGNRSNELEDQVTDQYLRYDRGHSSLRSLRAFSGRKIWMACLIRPSASANFTSCESHQTEVIQDALTIVNATLLKIVFSVGDSLDEYRAKNIDVLMLFQSVHNRFLADYDAPLVSSAKPITFYAKKLSTTPVTLRYILQGSNVSLCLLALCLLPCFAVLVVTDLLDATTSGMTVASDTILYFVATFYATSCDLPATVRFRVTRHCLILAWVAGILSFSVCFRAQLTSWLVSEIPESMVDDPIKLEAALDSNRIIPCVTRGLPEYYAINSSGRTGLLGKLKRSLGPQTTETVKETLLDCLKCASETARVCVALRQHPCVMKAWYHGLVESKEPLWLQYGAVPVRKRYPLKMAFRSLAERVFEADWMHRAYLRCKIYEARVTVQPTPVSLNLPAVTQILLLCFGVSLAVFLLELLLGQYFILRSRRLTRVRIA